MADMIKYHIQGILRSPFHSSILSWLLPNLSTLNSTRLQILLKDTLCFLCEIDGKEGLFVEPRNTGNRADDQFSAHLLEYIDSNGWSKYLPHLVKLERYIDPKTHQWKFKEEEPIWIHVINPSRREQGYSNRSSIHVHSSYHRTFFVVKL